jgi:hypothetical protein
MTRKAQEKFRMPGIKGRGFKMTASAPFKLKSSLKQDEKTDATELEFASTLGPEDDAYLESIQGSSKQKGQTGTNYFFEQLSKLAARNKQNKGKSNKLKEKEDEYEDIEPSENEKDPYRDRNKYPENFDEHGNYKGDLPEIYPEFNPSSSEGKLPWEEGYTRENDAHYTVEELDEIDFWKKHGYWPDEETEEQRVAREGEGD